MGVDNLFDSVVYLSDRISRSGESVVDVAQELVFIKVHRRLLSGEVQENFC